MPTMNQLFLGAQRRLPKKRMRDKKTPALHVLKNVEFVLVFIQQHLKNQTQLLEKLRRLD